MAPYGFRRSGSGRIVLHLAAGERDALFSLLGQLVDLVAPESPPQDDPLAAFVGIEPDAQPPTDPGLARLFPAGYDDDEPEAAADFRRFTERSLREGKVANARSMLDSLDRSGDKVTMSVPEATAWLGGLNDLRLLLGTRLEVDEDPDAMQHRIELLTRVALGLPGTGAATGDSDARELAVAELSAYRLYDWLTFLQASLLDAVAGAGLDPGDGWAEA